MGCGWVEMSPVPPHCGWTPEFPWPRGFPAMAVTFCRPQTVISHLTQSTNTAGKGHSLGGTWGEQGGRAALPFGARSASGTPPGSPSSVPRGTELVPPDNSIAQPKSGVNHAPVEKLSLQEGYLPEVAQLESRLVQGLIRNAPGEGSGCWFFGDETSLFAQEPAWRNTSGVNNWFPHCHRCCVVGGHEQGAPSPLARSSSTDLFSRLTIAPRFLTSRGCAAEMALWEAWGRAGPSLVPSPGGSSPSALPPSSCHPTWHTPPSPVQPSLAQCLSQFSLQRAARSPAWAGGDGGSLSPRNALMGLRVVPKQDKLPEG